jgi:hypothetical protein
MAKPSAPLSWATDATQTDGPEAGQPPRLEPPAGYGAQGWIATEEAPARYMNWALGMLGDWTDYLDNLAEEPDFLGEDFVWQGLHNFQELASFTDIQVTGETTLAGDLLAGGDAWVGAELTVDGDIKAEGASNEFQSLWVNNLLGMAGEVVYTDSGSPTPVARSRSTLLPLASGLAPFGVDDIYLVPHDSGKIYWNFSSSTTDPEVVFPLHLPHGATVTSVVVGVKNESIGSRDVSVAIMYNTAPHSGDPSDAFEQTMNVGNGTQAVASGVGVFITATPGGGGSPVIDSSASSYYVRVSSTLGNVHVYSVRVNWQDPGPRNY